MMNVETAIRTAIEFETKVRQLFETAARQIPDTLGRKFFELLAKDERQHVDSLTKALQEGIREGKVSYARLGSNLPSLKTIEKGTVSVQTQIKGAVNWQPDYSMMSILQSALEAEKSTSQFYRDLVGELPERDRKMFARMLDIEENHTAFVQAQIDSLTRNGVWLDVTRRG